jgi:hypothetical protein
MHGYEDNFEFSLKAIAPVDRQRVANSKAVCAAGVNIHILR